MTSSLFITSFKRLSLLENFQASNPSIIEANFNLTQETLERNFALESEWMTFIRTKII